MIDSTIPLKYKPIGSLNFKNLPQIKKYLTEEQIFNIEIVSSVLPFKTNNYVVDQLIDWENVPDDPIFILNFPQKEMLKPEHFDAVAKAKIDKVDKEVLSKIIYDIRLQLNPHPAGQIAYNVPEIEGIKLMGVQHKYKETLLFFPSQGQTCHAYCSFCFRWPQFVGIDELKFAMREVELLVKYVKQHPEITDILFTGGDPMIMKTSKIKEYVDALLDADLPNLQTIRFGTKALSYWPFRFTQAEDSEDLLNVFRSIVDAGKHITIMAHFNHYAELKTTALKTAIKAIRSTGAVIRTQSPIMKNINDSAEVWSRMWKEQVRLGCIPYYMFIARDTGAQRYFAIPLVKAWEIYRNAIKVVSGIARTARGPSMSAEPGKVHLVGITTVNHQKVMVLNFIQGRDPDWVDRPFLAKYNENAIWLDELEPAFNGEFFFEHDFDEFKLEKLKS